MCSVQQSDPLNRLTTASQINDYKKDFVTQSTRDGYIAAVRNPKFSFAFAGAQQVSDPGMYLA